ncbi:hypothetical protein D3C83_100730 [compost metagenome]
MLGAGEMQILPQHVHQQPVARFQVDFDRVAVDFEFDQHWRPYLLSRELILRTAC